MEGLFDEQEEQAKRDRLFSLITRLEKKNHFLFRRMYSHENLERPLREVCDEMHKDRLYTAIKQCERTLYKNGKS